MEDVRGGIDAGLVRGSAGQVTTCNPDGTVSLPGAGNPPNETLAYDYDPLGNAVTMR